MGEIIVPSLVFNDLSLAFEIKADEDVIFLLGRHALTNQSGADDACLSHYDHRVGATSYGFQQNQLGDTFINAVVNRTLSLGINGDNKVDLSAARLRYIDDFPASFGNSADAYLLWSTAQTNHALIEALGDSNMRKIVTRELYRTKNFDLPNILYPCHTLFSGDPDADNTNWLERYHDEANGIYDLGKGDHTFKTGKVIAELGLTSKALDLNVGAGAGLPHGSMSGYEMAETVTVTLQDTFYEIGAGLAAVRSNGLTFQNAKEYKVVSAGVYSIDWSISFHTASGTNQQVRGAPMLNGAADTTGAGERKVTTASDVGNMGGCTEIDCAVDDLISLCVANFTDTQNIVIDHCNMKIRMVEGT